MGIEPPRHYVPAGSLKPTYSAGVASFRFISNYKGINFEHSILLTIANNFIDIQLLKAYASLKSDILLPITSSKEYNKRR
ncbi:hypothetical protein [Planococcus sp. ISL-109]|uniref:hypothetical protein n=1 Tax=Planococcus sp. ISL-109 TaxID=2819166 RepID=UPI001BE9F831|nr:hypothetical protein [Planococcus sp. ISL-109]MBT2583949.1 hypothetical protein [Planococcus sp. ISL-109]